MKKIILLAIIALGITTTSCRKERTCDCKTTTTEVRTGFMPETSVSYSSTKTTKDKQKKKEFKFSQQCFSESYTYNESYGGGANGYSIAGTVDTKCELK